MWCVFTRLQSSQLLSQNPNGECGLTNRKYYHVESFAGAHAWKDMFWCARIRTIKQCVFFQHFDFIAAFFLVSFRFVATNLVIWRVFCECGSSGLWQNNCLRCAHANRITSNKTKKMFCKTNDESYGYKSRICLHDIRFGLQHRYNHQWRRIKRKGENTETNQSHIHCNQFHIIWVE